MALRNATEEMEVRASGEESLFGGINTQRKQENITTKCTPDREEVGGLAWGRGVWGGSAGLLGSGGRGARVVQSASSQGRLNLASLPWQPQVTCWSPGSGPHAPHS